MSAAQTTWYTYNTKYPASYIYLPMNFSGWNYGAPLGTVKPAPQPAKQLELDFDFDLALPVEKQRKVQVGNAEGYECSRCVDFYPFAELNQPDNAKEFIRFTCYGCRKGLNTVFENK